MKTLKSLALVGILTLIGAVHTPAQELIVNGDFMANAAAFTSSAPTYGFTGPANGNPAAITDWLNVTAGPAGLNGAATTGAGNVLGPVNPNGNTYAFIMGGVNALRQTLPGTYTPGTTYQLNFDAAGRAGESGVNFRVQIGDSTQIHFTTQVGGVDLTATAAAFVHYSYTFTTPATFTGSPVLELYAISPSTGTSSSTINYANVSLVPLGPNLVVNGNFMDNAAAFTSTAPSYGFTGPANGNPAAITDWLNVTAGPAGLNGAATTGAGNVLGPVNPNGNTYAFIMGGVNALRQTLPGTYTPGTTYQLNFDAAGRAGESGVNFRVQIGDSTQIHFTTQVGGVDLTATAAAFVHYSYTFTAPATFTGSPVLELYAISPSTGTSSSTINYANVSLVAAPARTSLLTDTFNTANTFDLGADLATRQSGTLATVGYTSVVTGPDQISISGQTLTLSRLDNTVDNPIEVSPVQNFFSYEVNNSFRVVCDINEQSADPAADCWAGIAVRGATPLTGPSQPDCFSMLLQPGGGYQIFDGTTLIGSGGGGSLNGQTNYNVVIDVTNNVARIIVNNVAVPFSGGLYTHLIVNANTGNYISFDNHASTAAVPATTTFDNLVVSVVPAQVIWLLNMQYVAGNASFQFYSQAGRVYGLDFKEHLSDPWSPASNITGTGGLQTVSVGSSTATKFFRLNTSYP